MADAAPGELRIGLSPEAAVRAERIAKLDLFKLAASGDLAARMEWAGIQPPLQTSILSEAALSPGTGAVRKRAIRELSRLSPSEDLHGEGLKALALVAVAEGDGGLRALARKALAARGDERVIPLLSRALANEDELVRSNAATALKAVGGPRVFEVIIEHWQEVWGPGPRTHVFFGNVRNYIADYDISGDAYDPVIRTLYTGVLLDSKVLRVEGDVWYVRIRELAPEADLPNNPAIWEEWLKKESPRLAHEAGKQQADAAAYFAGMKDE